jgi:murein DD-endopeptidase MepM/ murein hydrolase activator NlpD
MNIKYLIGLLFLLSSCAGMQARFHEVESGESLASIATQYQVPQPQIVKYNSERLKSGLKPGLKLYIPHSTGGVNYAKVAVEDVEEINTNRAPSNDALGVSFSWPVQGMVTSVFGKRKNRMHEGIDIGASIGTPVKAARSGHVIYAANRIPGYGSMVIVRHPGPFATVYAHLSKISVKKGQFLARGQVLGKVGRTGRAHGPHLHFEIRNQRVPVDPLLYLQGQYAANKIRNR